MADYEVMSVEGVDDAKAHKGMMLAAYYVLKLISQHHLLEKAFERAEVNGRYHLHWLYPSVLL